MLDFARCLSGRTVEKNAKGARWACKPGSVVGGHLSRTVVSDRLKASREEFRGEYKKLLQHFMDDAEAMFPMQGSLASAPNGSAGTTHADAPVSAPATVAAPIPAPAPAVSAGDFGDLD